MARPPLPQPAPGERADLAEIVPGLFLGSWRAAADGELLRRCGVEHVLNLCEGDTCDAGPFRWSGQEHHVEAWPRVRSRRWLPARDDPSFDLAAHFEAALEFLRDHLDAGRSVLVHCRAGASRSATVVLAHLMTRHRLRLSEAESLAASRRPDVCPNSGFRRQLEALDAALAAAAGPQAAASGASRRPSAQR